MNTDKQQELKSQLRAILSPVARDLGLYISAIELITNAQGLNVTVYLDGPQGVSIDNCAAFTRNSSPILDVEDPISSAYTLEVSSPGFNRLIEIPEDFKRFESFRIRVKLFHKKKKIDGILESSNETEFVLVGETTTRTISYADCSSVRLLPTPEQYEQLAPNIS
ncbi:MAG: ribosome maturation factor RimP [Myxococcota bacterium]|nr:ribosome maturation factor RimP [Myxococcota bacterium]